MADNGSSWAPGTWTRIEKTAVDRVDEVGLAAFWVYARLSKHLDEHRRCWPSLDRLGGNTLARRAVQYAIARLESAGWVVVERTPGKGNRYYLPPLAPVHDGAPVHDDARDPCTAVHPTRARRCTGPVHGGAQEGTTEKEPQERTTRKEPRTKSKRPRPEDVQVPAALDTPDFRTAWAEWLAYRRERKLTLSRRTLAGQLRKLETLGPMEAVKEIQASIDNGYQSVVYGNRSNGNGSHRPTRGRVTAAAGKYAKYD